VQTDGDMLRLLDPIEADGVLESRIVGSIRVYRLVQHPWTAALATAVLEHRPDLASRVSAAKTMLRTGASSGLVHLRRRLGL
jgi:hypothetical protein